MAKGNQKRANGSALEFEAQLWAAAEKMRSHVEIAAVAAQPDQPAADPFQLV